MKRTRLGEFEELVLLIVAIIDGNAYGVSIAEEMSGHLSRSVSLSPVHTALYRLENKGYVHSEIGGATNERGGRRKRLYEITTAGRAALDENRALRNNLWNLLPEI